MLLPDGAASVHRTLASCFDQTCRHICSYIYVTQFLTVMILLSFVRRRTPLSVHPKSRFPSMFVRLRETQSPAYLVIARQISNPPIKGYATPTPASFVARLLLQTGGRFHQAATFSVNLFDIHSFWLHYFRATGSHDGYPNLLFIHLTLF